EMPCACGHRSPGNPRRRLACASTRAPLRTECAAHRAAKRDSAWRALPRWCWRMESNRAGGLDGFQKDDAALAAVRTNADDRALSRGTRRQLLHRLAQDPGARRAERMAERDTAPVRVHSVARKGAQRRLDARLATQK